MGCVLQTDGEREGLTQTFREIDCSVDILGFAVKVAKIFLVFFKWPFLSGKK